jgi:two-component system, chemotaxis family, protein-glutamate methylesterase/glutaminase
VTRIAVLVVDDSVVVRRLVSDALSSDPAIEVVGVAANGKIAQTKVNTLHPDIVTMDIEMPEMNGIEAVRALRASGHRVPIIMFSTLTERGASATLDALAAGATDYVTKPANTGSVQASLARVAGDLIPRIKALVPHRGGRPKATVKASPPPPPPARERSTRSARPRAIVLGTSTGGPEALSTVVQGLRRPLPVPMLVVQHMPPVFTAQLATRLDKLGPNHVVEAAGDEVLVPGTIYVAPGDRHLEVQQVGGVVRTRLTQGPQVNFCRPAVDVLFTSAAAVFHGDLFGVVLTGMGADGRDGCRQLVDAGGTVVVQDEDTSVVWGMPGAVASAGLAHEIIPISKVAEAIERSVLAAPSGQLAGGAR